MGVNVCVCNVSQSNKLPPVFTNRLRQKISPNLPGDGIQAESICDRRDVMGALDDKKEKRVKSGSDREGASSSQSDSSASLGSLKGGEVATGKLLDLAEGANVALVHSGTKQTESDPLMVHNHATENNNTVWELEDGLDEAFSRLAESRTNPQVLDIGVNPQDFNTEECLSPGKWDQEDADFTAQKDTLGF